jgi:hypothetical protein
MQCAVVQLYSALPRTSINLTLRTYIYTCIHFKIKLALKKYFGFMKCDVVSCRVIDVDFSEYCTQEFNFIFLSVELILTGKVLGLDGRITLKWIVDSRFGGCGLTLFSSG